MNFVKIDEDSLEQLLVSKGHSPVYVLVGIKGKTIYLHECDERINLEVKRYYNIFSQMIRKMRNLF